MSKINKILSVLLIAQLALAALTWSTCSSKPKVSGTVPVFDFKIDQVVELEVIPKPDKDGKTPEVVKLTKKKDQWVVATADDYPADNDKVKKVLEKLVSLRVRDPIAKSTSSHNALRVGEQEYDRMVTLKTAKVTKTIIAGSGAGSSIHVRYKGDKNVYRANGVSVWSINTGVRSYVDTKYIDIDKDKLLSVAISNEKGQLTFTKEGEGWLLSETPRGSELDESKVKTLIGKVSKLNMVEPVGKEVKAEYGLAAGTKVILVSTEEDATKSTTYSIGAPKDDQHFYVKSEDNDYVVSISKYDANQVREKAVEDLLKKKEEKEEK